MKWQHSGPTAMSSEDGRYIINRSPQEGYPGPITFMLVDVQSHVILGVEREVDDTREARTAAIRRLRDLVEVRE